MRPTMKDVFARLREVEGVSSDTKLAFKLDMDPRTLARWKRKAPNEVEKAIELLDRAGAISWSGADTAPDPEMAALLAELEGAFDETLTRMRSLLSRQAQPRNRGAR